MTNNGPLLTVDLVNQMNMANSPCYEEHPDYIDSDMEGNGPPECVTPDSSVGDVDADSATGKIYYHSHS